MSRTVPEALTEAQLDELSAALRQLRSELRTVVADEAGLAGTVTLDQAAMGRVSRNDALQQQEMAKAGRRRAELRLERIKAALDRVAEGEYGDCPDCGEPIGYRRLRAMPETVFCVSCLEARGG